jgi:hypothetical protein
MRYLLYIVLAFSIAFGAHAQVPLLPQPDRPLPEFAAATIKPNCICLAGSVLDNLQGFGLWQKEQLFEEFSGGPELLAASL